MNEIYDAISQVGFPILISLLLLVRVEKRMESLGEKIERLNDGINTLTTMLDERIGRRKR